MTERYGESALRAERIREMIADDPKLSDREIARRLGVHHSAANRVRHEMGENTSIDPGGTRQVAIKYEAIPLEVQLAKLRKQADELRTRCFEMGRDANSLWAAASQLGGELWSLQHPPGSNGGSE